MSPFFTTESGTEDREYVYARHAVRLTSDGLAATLKIASAWDKARSSVSGKRTPKLRTLKRWCDVWQGKKSGKGSFQNRTTRKRIWRDRPWAPGQTTAPAESLQEDHLLQEIANHFDPHSANNADCAFYDSSSRPISLCKGVRDYWKPDTVLLHSSCEGKAEWYNIQGLVEYTTQPIADISPRGLHPGLVDLIDRLETCILIQPGRQYMLGISVYNSAETGRCAHDVVALTRSELLVAGHKDTFAEDGLLDLAAWLNFLKNADLEQLGHLSAFCDAPQKNLSRHDVTACTIKLKGKAWRAFSCVQAPSQTPFSKCTSVWRVEEVQPIRPPQPERRELIMKLSWPRSSDIDTLPDGCAVPREVQVLEQLKRKSASNPALRARVPDLQGYDVLGPPIGHTEALHRQPVAIVCVGEGQPISHTSLPDLGAFLDFSIDLWEGYGDILNAGVAHKDLSLNNVTVRKTDTGSVRAFFIDFGASVLIDGNFKIAPDWVSRAHTVTMTPDCASYAGLAAGHRMQYRFSVRQELESLLNLVYRIVLHFPPETRFSRRETVVFSIVTPSQSPRTTSNDVGAASYSSGDSTPLNSSGFDPIYNVRLGTEAQASVLPWIQSLTDDERHESPAPMIAELLFLLRKFDEEYKVHPSHNEQEAWAEVRYNGANIPAEYLATDKIRELIREVARRIKTFKRDLTESQLDLSLSSPKAPKSSKTSKTSNHRDA